MNIIDKYDNLFYHCKTAKEKKAIYMEAEEELERLPATQQYALIEFIEKMRKGDERVCS